MGQKGVKSGRLPPPGLYGRLDTFESLGFVFKWVPVDLAVRPETGYKVLSRTTGVHYLVYFPSVLSVSKTGPGDPPSPL